MVKRKSLPKKDASFSQTSPTKKNDPSKMKRKNKIYTKALQEIRHLQKSSHLLIPRAPFLRLVCFFLS